MSLKQRSAGAQINRRLLSYCSSLSTSAKFFTRLYALDKDGSRRRRTVRQAILFTNLASFIMCRLKFLTIADATKAIAMQIAEIELLGR